MEVIELESQKLLQGLKEVNSDKTGRMTVNIARKHVKIRRHLTYSRIEGKSKVDISQVVHKR